MLFRCKVVGERDQASVAMLNLFAGLPFQQASNANIVASLKRI
jgi:hypothetical protein